MVRNRTVLTVGFEMNDIPMNDVRVIGKVLTSLREFRGNRATLFGDITAGCTPEVRAYIDKFWQQIVDKGSLDLINAA